MVVAIDQTEALSSLNEFAENDRILLGTVVDQASDASLIALTVVPYLFLSYFNQILALYGALR